MNFTEQITIISISLIFAATTFGAFLVYFMKKDFGDRTSNAILGFASGVMIAAAFFGLILPAIDEATKTGSAYANFELLPVLGGFLLGGGLLYAIDKLVPHIHKDKEEEGLKTNKISKNFKFFLAVTIHNIPEGLAVGFACGLALAHMNDGTNAYAYAALSLAIGIAIQNVPEGAAVSIPMFGNGMSKNKSFLFGTLSGVVEPIFALLGLFVSISVDALMPWILSFGAGAMIYVTIDELIPEMRKGGYVHYGLWSFMIGFAVMMALEILLS